MSHWRNDSGSPAAEGGCLWGGRFTVFLITGAIELWTAAALPTASMPGVARSVAAKDPLADRASTAPTAL